MDYSTYKLLHLFGLAITLASLGGLSISVQVEGNPQRKMLTVFHGVGILILLVAGFGLLAKIGMGGLPMWAMGKLVLWLLLAVYPVLLRKVPGFAKASWYGLFLIVPLAAWLAVSKPF